MHGANALCFSLNQSVYRSLTKPTTSTPRMMKTLQTLEPSLTLQFREKILCLEIMGVDSGKVLSLNPSLQYATLDSIQSVIYFLQSKGIQQKDFARIFGMCPKILTSNIKKDLDPVFNFLSNDMNIPENNYRKAINKCPRLLVSSVQDQLKPTLLYLQNLGFTDSKALAYQDAILLVSNLENTLIPKFEYLMYLGFKFQEVKEMVLRCPALFTFSVENNFKPKFGYYSEEMKGKLEELKGFPQYFAFSLENRIKPRHKKMVDRGIWIPLAVLLKSTDEEFREFLKH